MNNIITICVTVSTCVFLSVVFSNYMLPIINKIDRLESEIAFLRSKVIKQDSFLCSRFGNDYLNT
jgi:hypothetical protein